LFPYISFSSLVTITVVPMVTGMKKHFIFHIRWISILRPLYFNLFSVSCITFLFDGIATSISKIIIIIIIINITCHRLIAVREHPNKGIELNYYLMFLCFTVLASELDVTVMRRTSSCMWHFKHSHGSTHAQCQIICSVMLL
jgi:hypothetical protein